MTSTARTSVGRRLRLVAGAVVVTAAHTRPPPRPLRADHDGERRARRPDLRHP